jgi:uncharacterized membrane protein
MDRITDGGPAKLMLAAAAGMLLMYLLDPRQGRRRVALARDQAARLARKGADLTDAGARDLAHRATGIASSLRGALHRVPPDDDVLAQRVRSKMGRWTSHAHAIEVCASDGRVTLKGPVLHSEHRRLLRAAGNVRGVREVEDRLEVHGSADGVPSLQGGSGRSGPSPEMMQGNWSAGPRLLAAVGGTVLAIGGLGRRRGLGGALLAIMGAGLAARAATNIEFRRMVGVSGGRRAVDIEKAIHIDAPRETVFDLWSDYQNFPHFMSHVEEVRALDETRSHWVVKGPAGAPLEWDAIITEHVRPQVLAWRTEPGAPVQHAGIVRFDDEGDGSRVSVRMSYHPPGGAVGHAVAKLLGRDPKQEMDADLMRMKAFIETGRAPHDAAARSGNRLGVAASP